MEPGHDTPSIGIIKVQLEEREVTEGVEETAILSYRRYDRERRGTGQIL